MATNISLGHVALTVSLAYLAYRIVPNIFSMQTSRPYQIVPPSGIGMTKVVTTDHKNRQDPNHPFRRIIVCCDGTWMDSDGSTQVPSNVTRFARAVRPMGYDADGRPTIPQLIFYTNGIGSGDDDWWNKYVAGATGGGLSERIREAYAFVCLNYCPGDEIFILGFSRGAFTARSVASLISDIGLLTPMGLKYFYQIFEDWENQVKAADGLWKSTYDTPWTPCPPLKHPTYMEKMVHLELTRPNIPIKAVGVWDTVGALGIPRLAVFRQPVSEQYSFVDASVSPNIEYAFHALALDEHRRSFSPTIWEKPAGQTLPHVLKQTWFPGVHSDIGGAYTDADLANLTLAWMVSNLDPLLSINHDYIISQVRLNAESNASLNPTQPPRPWGLGQIHDSMTLFYRLGGSVNRTPKEYERVDPYTFAYTGERLQNTHERVHACVRLRINKNGLGYNDKGIYRPPALQGWKYSGDPSNPDTPFQRTQPGEMGSLKNVVWRKRLESKGQIKRGEFVGEVLEMQEDVLGDLEKRVLQLWPEIQSEYGGEGLVSRGDEGKPAARKGQTWDIRNGNGRGRGREGLRDRDRDSGIGSVGEDVSEEHVLIGEDGVRRFSRVDTR